MRTISIIGTDIHGPEDWWATHHPEEDPILNERLKFDRADLPSMVHQYHELAVDAEIDGIAVGLRSANDISYQYLGVFREAAQTFVLQTGLRRPRFMPFIDTVGLINLEHTWDYANPAHNARFWPEYLKPYLDVYVDTAEMPWERTPDGRPLICWWGAKHRYSNGTGTTNEHACGNLLAAVTEAMANAGLGMLAHIVDRSWIDNAPHLAQTVYGVHEWFNPPGQSYTIRRHGAVTTGVLVPAFGDGPDVPPAQQRIIPRRDGATLRDGLAAMRAAKADYVFIESYNNRVEAAGLYSTPIREQRELHIVREHIRQTRQPDTGEPPMSAVSQQPLFVLDHAAVIKNADGTKALRWNLAEKRTDASKDRVFSLQDTGEIQDRPASSIGAWESGTVEGDRLVFRAGEARAVFAWQA
jgi:uncharacterized protein DUF5010